MTRERKALEKLARLLDEHEITPYTFALTNGRDERTIQRYIKGEKIPESFVAFLSRLKSIEFTHGEAVVTLRMPIGGRVNPLKRKKTTR